MHRLLSIAALASLICVIGNASAQTAPSKTGIIRGIVRDDTEALIPGVQLTLSTLEKTEVKKVVSGPLGEYLVEAPAGTYELKAELRGFKTSMTGPVRLNENETVRIMFMMAVDVPGRPLRPPVIQ